MRKAADQGLAVAQHELAFLHESGTGTTRDQVKARKWHEAAARGGNVTAMFDYATYNYNGEGGEANSVVAAEWFRKAAEFGHTDSQYNLASLYADGTGVSPSQIEAYYWLELAAKGGDVLARQEAQALIANGLVSQTAAEQINQRVAGWRPATSSAVSNGRFGTQSWQGAAPAEQTLAVQQVLEALGYPVGTADGVMGGQTRAAIREFEASAGLRVTGTITPELITGLNAAADAKRRKT